MAALDYTCQGKHSDYCCLWTASISLLPALLDGVGLRMLSSCMAGAHCLSSSSAPQGSELSLWGDGGPCHASLLRSEGGLYGQLLSFPR